MEKTDTKARTSEPKETGLHAFSTVDEIASHFRQTSAPDLRLIPQISIMNQGYHVDIGLNYIEDFLRDAEGSHTISWDPDFQRGYVWSLEQKRAYIEWFLRGGPSGRDVFFNCPGYRTMGMRRPDGSRFPMEIVDGKQRLSAMLAFLRNEIPAFGFLYDDYKKAGGGHARITAGFRVHVLEIESRPDLIRWYLLMNSGGTIHSDEDLRVAREALARAASSQG